MKRGLNVFHVQLSSLKGKDDMSIKKLTATAVAVTMIAGSSWAAPISLKYNGSAAGYSTVTLNSVPVPVAGNLTRVSAGGFNMSDTTPNGLGDFIAWCLDLGAFLGTSGEQGYAATTNPFQNGGVDLMAAGMARVQSVFDANFSDTFLSGPNAQVNRTKSAAFQLSLWEAVYDDDWDITMGGFQATAGQGVEDLAESYLLAAMNWTGGSNWDLTYLESTGTDASRHQNLVTAAPSPVPLPASGIMLLAAIGGLVAARKKRRK